MRIVYVVESMDLSGGVKAIVEQAEGLAGRGHEVAIVTKHPDHSWIPVSVPLLPVDRFDASTLPPADVHVATWFPTVAPVVRAAKARAVFHFCQGYEALYPNCFGRLDEVEEAYLQPVPKLLVSAHLADLLARFPGEKLPLRPSLRFADYAPGVPKEAPAAIPAIGVVGPIELSIKGVECAIRAVERFRRVRPARLMRASQLPLSDAERLLTPPGTYLCRGSVDEMIRWYRECDLLIHASWPAEGLGLPPFEAMAAGVPAVIADIPSLRVIPEGVVSRVAPGDEEAMAAAALELLGNPRLWRERRERGLAAVREFGLPALLDLLERYFRDALAAS